MMNCVKNFYKGLNNLFVVSTVNILILICIILILIITYLNTGNIELFTIDNNYFASFINTYIKNIDNTTKNKQILAKQQQTIQSLTKQVTDLINTYK